MLRGKNGESREEKGKYGFWGRKGKKVAMEGVTNGVLMCMFRLAERKMEEFGKMFKAR